MRLGALSPEPVTPSAEAIQIVVILEALTIARLLRQITDALHGLRLGIPATAEVAGHLHVRLSECPTAGSMTRWKKDASVQPARAPCI